LSQAQPLLELLAFPADFCVNSVGNTFPANFAKDLDSQVRKYFRILGSAGNVKLSVENVKLSAGRK